MFYSRAPLCLASALVLLATGIGCRKDSSQTGLRVEVVLNGLNVDQLGFQVSHSMGVFPLGDPRRPQHPSGQLADPQIIEIYLPDPMTVDPMMNDKLMVTVDVVGYSANQEAGKDSHNAELKVHVLTPVPIKLVRLVDGGAEVTGELPNTITDADAMPRGDLPGADLGGGGSPREQGAACLVNEECSSGQCVDRVCCLSTCGACYACNIAGSEGKCAPLPAMTRTDACADQPPCGYNGTCDGKGGCAKTQAGFLCHAASCASATLTPASACDGAGNCVALVDVSCAPFRCDSTGTPHCGTTCQSQIECAANAQCINNSCGQVPKKPLGAGCVTGSDCQSTFCTDGVCCEGTCTTQCTSCNQAGSLGACKSVPAGKPDPRGVCQDSGAASCGNNGLCNGSNGCGRYTVGTICQPARCQDHTVIGARHCDATGTCAAGMDIDCQPYRCNSSSNSCFSDCIIDLQCTSIGKKACKNGVCI